MTLKEKLKAPTGEKIAIPPVPGLVSAAGNERRGFCAPCPTAFPDYTRAC